MKPIRSEPIEPGTMWAGMCNTCTGEAKVAVIATMGQQDHVWRLCAPCAALLGIEAATGADNARRGVTA